MTGHEYAKTSASRVEQPGERETANHSGLKGAHTARAAERSGHRPDYARHEAIVALTAWQPADSSIGTVVLPGKVSNGAGYHFVPVAVTGDGSAWLASRAARSYPAELHTDGALPPFSRASSPQKLASPTFHVPSW